MFKHYVIIGDLGTDTLPILIDLGDGVATVAQVYEQFPWIKKPEVQELISALKGIESVKNREAFVKMTDEVCNKWFEHKGCGKIMIDRKAKSIDVTRWWYHQPPNKKRLIMKHYSK